MEKCLKLVRVSSDGQDERNQDAEVDAHIAKHGYHVEREIRLHDVSAYKGEQAEALEAIRNDILAGRYTVVVVAHSSRIDRRDPDIAMLWTLHIRMAGGRIESVREPEFGRGDVGGRVLTMLAQDANHKYSKGIGDSVRAAQNRARKNKAFVSGAIPFGFEVIGEKECEKRLRPTAEGKRIIREVYDRITRGHSRGAVAEWVTEELKKADDARAAADAKALEENPEVILPKWRRRRSVWAATIGDWVRNPVYKGFLCQRVQDKGTHTFGKVIHEVPPIVTVPVWKAANAALDARQVTVVARKGGLMTGVLRCGNCGAKMYKIPTASYWAYYCKKTPIGGGCGNLVKKDVTDQLAVGKVSRLFLKVSRQVLVPGQNYEEEIHDVMMRLQGLNLRDKDERARQAELLEELDRLESLETTSDRIELVESEETIGDEFAAVPEDGRNAWLREHGIAFTALNTKKFQPRDAVDIQEGELRSPAAGEGVLVVVISPLSRIMSVGEWNA